MAAGEEASATRSLEDTPTWAVAAVCLVFVSLSILIEYLIHLVSNWLKRRRKTALYDAIEKLKSVLMVLGFMSLALTVTRSFISRICIPNKLANSMLPCRKTLDSIKANKDFVYEQTWSVDALHERILAVDSESSDFCNSKVCSYSTNMSVSKVIMDSKKWEWQGKTSLISEEGTNQLSIFLFVLAAMQIVYTVLTMALGRAKTHLATNTSFNFQNYIQRSLDDDFKVLVGISPFMWLWVVIFLMLDVHGWNVYLWVSFLPLTITLILGTKLQVIMAKMAQRVKDQNNVILGAPLVQPNDNLFWVTVQVICSYVTLPLYALVTQMGSNFKRAVLEEQTANAIKQWHAGVKLKRKKNRQSSPADDSPSTNTSVSTSAHQHPTPASSEIASSSEIQEEPGPALPTSDAVDTQMVPVGKSLTIN
ncbi:hypothetical protein V6N13_010698 [Hibiscus sabdariffa]